MTARYVGIDPGMTGAAVVVGADGLEVLDLQAWHRSRVPPAITVVLAGDVVALEAQHVGRGNHASLVLAEWTGRLAAALPPGITILRPLATSWRAKVLRDGRLQREPAKRLAIAAATPHLVAAGWTDVTADIAEAWCMARYACFWALSHPAEVSSV